MVKYYGTKRTGVAKRRSGTDMTILYLPKDWELDPDKVYNFSIRKLEGDTTYRFSKTITSVGQSAQRIVINEIYGIAPGEMIVFSVEEMARDEFYDDCEDL